MAAALPAKLKIPGIQPFATRAAQLEKFKPIVAYWCNYHVVNQILSKGLHSADDECKEYTINLMDKLETAKNQTPPVDAIVDDIAAKAYVEQFALETFQKGDKSIHTDSASRQTIDTFQAASTFLELLSIWGPLEPETSAQIKYAKYHALRIAKAIKAGEDPNASNPKDEPEPEGIEPGSEVYDSVTSPPPAAAYAPPTVEEDDEGAVDLSAATLPNTNTAEPTQSSYTGDYFPPTPANLSEPTAPTAAPTLPDIEPSGTATPAAHAPPSNAVEDFYTQQPSQPPPQSFSTPPVKSPFVPPQVAAPLPVRQAAPPPQQSAPTPAATAYRTDDEAVALAQKYAKWAISALNFEDVPTAVRELRKALDMLGAS